MIEVAYWDPKIPFGDDVPLFGTVYVCISLDPKCQQWPLYSTMRRLVRPFFYSVLVIVVVYCIFRNKEM